MKVEEVNFDGLVGTTHHYGGLAIGNRASERNAHAQSNPREAALQGLDKMKAMADLGAAQAVLPPQERPHVPTLRQLGFGGSDADVLGRAQAEAPALLAACASASSMWTANAATVSASADCADQRLHITPANLCAQFHRALETRTTARIMHAIFRSPEYFVHHPPLPATPECSDEGAANHTRLVPAAAGSGVTVLVYGRTSGAAQTRRYPARQSRQASAAIARQHRLDPAHTIIAGQNPQAVDAGVFHNDVIAVGHGNVMFCHEAAFTDQAGVRAQIEQAFGAHRLHWLEVPAPAVSLATAVETYLFNSQLVTLPGTGTALVVPVECRESPAVWSYLQTLTDGSTPIKTLHTMDVRQSMRNGGGPACLRLRVPLSDHERAATRPGVFLNDALYRTLSDWIQRYYRDRLSAHDLADPDLLWQTRTALDELTQLLGLGPLYDFQLNFSTEPGDSGHERHAGRHARPLR